MNEPYENQNKVRIIGDFVDNFTDEIYLQFEAIGAMYVYGVMQKMGEVQAFTGADLSSAAKDLFDVWIAYLYHLDKVMWYFVKEASDLAGADLSMRYRNHIRDLDRVYYGQAYSAFDPKSKRFLDRFKSPNERNFRKSFDSLEKLLREEGLPNSSGMDELVWIAANKDMKHRGKSIHSLGPEIANKMYEMSDALKLRADAHDWMKSRQQVIERKMNDARRSL
jgi:hypothetical protein